MPQYDNEKRGALFKNDDKETEKHADYKGSCEIEGVQYWISAWLRTSKAGAKYMSLQLVSKRPRDRLATHAGATPKPEERYSGQADIDDSEIPF